MVPRLGELPGQLSNDCRGVSVLLQQFDGLHKTPGVKAALLGSVTATGVTLTGVGFARGGIGIPVTVIAVVPPDSINLMFPR